MQYKRILAVGDIHGMYDKLIALMEKVKFNPEQDLLIFLGDYIDRGPHSLECLDYVMALNKQYPEWVIPLLGNHEYMCVGYILCEKYDFGRELLPDFRIDLVLSYAWSDNGGEDTYRKLKTLEKCELEKRLRWLAGLPI